MECDELGNYLSENQASYSKFELSRSPNRSTWRTLNKICGT